MIETKAGPDTSTFYYEGNERVYPCRCGETHRGPYGFYDWYHHECNHGKVWVHDEIDATGYCIECGQTILLTHGELNGRNPEADN